MTVVCFISVQKLPLVMIAADLSSQDWIPRSVSAPAVKAFILLEDGAGGSVAALGSVGKGQQMLEPECCERS